MSAAVRIVPEWQDYDNDVRQLQKKILSGLLDEDPAEEIKNGGFRKKTQKYTLFTTFYFTDTPDSADIHTEL